MGEDKPTEQIEVPDVSGMDPDTCRDTLEEYGLYLKQRGVATSQITATPPRAASRLRRARR